MLIFGILHQVILAGLEIEYGPLVDLYIHLV